MRILSITLALALMAQGILAKDNKGGDPRGKGTGNQIGVVDVTFRVRLPATTTEDAYDQTRKLKVPLFEKTAGCGQRYRVLPITASYDEARRQGIASVSLRIEKLVSGREPEPRLSVVLKGNQAKLVSFDLTKAIDIGKWPTRGYVIKAVYDFELWRAPETWSRIEIECP